MTKSLINSKVIIYENDFTDRNAVATIINVAEDYKAMLLKLRDPLVWNKKRLNYVVAKTRLVNDSFEPLKFKKTIGCGTTWISKEKLNPQEPFDTSWWRGGAAAITSLKLL